MWVFIGIEDGQLKIDVSQGDDESFDTIGLDDLAKALVPYIADHLKKAEKD